MKKNKLTASLLLGAFCFAFTYAPSYAITETKKAQKQAKEVQFDIFKTINIEKWQKKNDPFLEDYILRAVDKNFDIKTAALKIEEAKQNVTLVRANQLPTLTAGVSPAIAKMPNTTKSMGSFAIPLFASYELDLFGKNWDKTKSAKKILESTAYEAQSADIAIISTVAGTYYNIVNLDKIIEIQEKLAKNRAEIYRLSKLSYEAGLVSMSDLSLAEKSNISAQNELIQYRKTRQNALNSLSVLIAEDANNIKDFKRADFDEILREFDIPQEISTEIVTERPDYKAAEKRLEAAGLNIRAAKKEFLPSFNILGLISFVATSAATSMNWQNAVGMLAGSANLPIFTGLKRTANIKLNKNKYEQLVQNYQKTNLKAIQEVNDALYNYKADYERFLNNKRTYEIQENDFKLANGKFENGVISKLELLQQEENLLYVQKLLTQSRTDCYLDEIGLYNATGGKI